MKKEILTVLLPQFADWEASFTMAALNHQIQNIESRYVVKTVGLTKEPIKSIGGLTVLPDYTIDSLPPSFSAILLIGGMAWCDENRRQTQWAKKLIPLVQTAVENAEKTAVVVGAICDATTFLGANGWLNNVKHTSNTLEDLEKVAGENYTNRGEYLEQQGVCDKNIITANGTAYLEFTCAVLSALGAYPMNDINAHYDFYKNGYYEAMKTYGVAKGI